MAFVRNAYTTPDLSGPNNGFPLRTYKQLLIDVQGTLTIAGGAADGLPVIENPRSLIKAIEIQLSGSPLGDAFISMPLTDLVVLNMTEYRSLNSDPIEDGIESGAAGAYTFRGRYVLPFVMPSFSNPYKGMFVAGKPGISQVSLRIRWGTEEDLVAGGDRVKTISATTATVYGVDFTGFGGIESSKELFYHQRIASITKTYNATAGVDQDIIFPRTPAFLKGILMKQMTVDANGVETPSTTLIRATDPIVFMLNTLDRKYDLTWEQVQERNRRDYRRTLPDGYIFLDMAPEGDEELIRLMLMTNFSEMKVRFNNASVANGVVRASLVKYAQA